jgi:aryl-alcohol dehydrogenase-like predicted oxidoreductase
MEYRRLGNSGLTVSRIALGCMSFGDVSRGFSEWSLGDEDAEPFFQQALELGINFWDTANVYGYGSSEEIAGRALRKYTRRDDIILATKVHFKVHDGPGRFRTVPQGDHGTDRRLTSPAGYRLRRSIPDPPLRPEHTR